MLKYIFFIILSATPLYKECIQHDFTVNKCKKYKVCYIESENGGCLVWKIFECKLYNDKGVCEVVYKSDYITKFE